MKKQRTIPAPGFRAGAGKKRIGRSGGLWLAGAAVILGCCAYAHAYTIVPYRQNSSVPMNYQINRFTFISAQIDVPPGETITDGHDHVMGAIKQAFQTWSDVPTSTWTAHFESVLPPPDAYAVSSEGVYIRDGLNTVSFEALPTGVLGLTILWYGTTPSGFVEETDIVLTNSASVFWTTNADKITEAQQVYLGILENYYQDVETVTLHEIGHAVGLGHVTGEPRVCVVETAGNRLSFTTYNGGAVSSSATFVSYDGTETFSSPQGADYDPTNLYLFVADTGNHRIVKLSDLATNFVAKWGTKSDPTEINPQTGTFRSPRDVATDSDGNVYVADTGNNRIQKFTSGGRFIRTWGSGGTGDGKFDLLSGIAIDRFTRNNYVYVADTDNHRIQKFDADGTFVSWWGYDGINVPVGQYPNNVHSPGSGLTGKTTFLAGGFSLPRGVAVDSFGYVYVADTGNDRIQKFNSSGKLISSWTANSPVSVDVDISGAVYVLDSENGLVLKYAYSESTFGYVQDTSWTGATGGGLAVDMENQDKVMYPYVLTVSRKLTHDEINGVSNLYPGTGVTAPAAGGGGGCFIATAAYGSALAEEVKWLSRFRDQYLLKSEWGRQLVSFYYRFSPPLAEEIRRNEPLKRAVRVALRPLIWFSREMTSGQ